MRALAKHTTTSGRSIIESVISTYLEGSDEENRSSRLTAESVQGKSVAVYIPERKTKKSKIRISRSQLKKLDFRLELQI